MTDDLITKDQLGELMDALDSANAAVVKGKDDPKVSWSRFLKLTADRNQLHDEFGNASVNYVRQLLAQPAGSGGGPDAWLHTVVQDDGEQDSALSFSPDSFPLQGVGGFKSIGVRPLYAAAPASPQGDDRDYKALYEDLILQVGMKWPNESRHDTAKRYITERENSTACSDASSGDGRGVA